MGDRGSKQVHLDAFVTGLGAIPDTGFTAERVFAYLQANPVDPSSLQPYLFFHPGSYTRNLVFKNDLFELIAICWEVGQESRIHNHRDQQCWMAVPMGKLKNQNYRVVARDQETKTCQIEPSRSCLITPETPLAVDPAEPVHQVLNLAEFRERAVSLHVYSRPFSSCEVYSLEQCKYWDVDLHYDTDYRRASAPVKGSPLRPR